MKKLFTLLTMLIVGIGSSWAKDVVISDRTNTVATGSVTTTNEHKYGTYSNAAGGTTFTTNATSGMAGVTVTADEAMIRAAWFSNTNYLYVMGFNPDDTNEHTITISAPDGYIVTGYSITAISTSTNRKFTVTPDGDTPSTDNVTSSLATFTKTGLSNQTATITIKAANNGTGNFLCFPLFSVTVLSATIPTVNVTYELYESDGTTLVNSVVKEQEQNSDIEVPTSLTAPTYYDYSTEGTIGTSNCTIKVIRTLKSGYVISLDGLSNTKCYNIRNNRGTWAVGSNTTVVNSTYELNLAFLASDTKQQFAFITYEGNVYLYSVGEHKFAYVDGTKLSLTADVTSAVAASPVTFQASTASSANAEPIIVKVGGQMYGVSTGKTPDVFQYNVANDGGNSAIIIEAGSFDATSALAALEEYFHPTATYILQDEGGNTIFTSDPVEVSFGETITEIPSSLERPYCTYTVTETTIGSGNNNVIVTVTYAPPFTVSSNFASATWYYATLRGKQLRADESHKDGSGRYQTNSTNERTDVYKWAFVGNPYQLSIINKGAGDSKVLYMGTQPVMQAATPASDSKARWIVSANSTGGFTVRSESGATMYINDAGNGGNLGFWNSSSGANDAGSNWVVVEASSDDKSSLGDAITTATTLVNGSGIPGYPNTEAAATLSDAITTAQDVYDNPSGDHGSTCISLKSAIATATTTSNINYIPRTDVYYTITSTRGSMVYDSSHDSSYDAEGNKFLWYTTNLDNTNVNHLWGFIEQDGKYYIYNVGRKQFATVSTSGSYQLNDKGTWVFSDTPAYVTFDAGINNSVAAPKVRVRATVATTSSTYSMSISTGYTGPVITYDAQGDGGIPMLIAESSVEVDDDITAEMTNKVDDPTPYRNALKDIIDGCADLNIGTGPNTYASNSTYEDALDAANTAYEDDNATRSELQTITQNLEDAIAGLVINTPGAGFYRIKGNTTSKYLAAGLASNSKFNMTDATDATTIFYYDGTKLTNLSSGMCNGLTAKVGSDEGWNWVVSTSASTVTFLDGHTNGGYGIRSNTVYIYDNGNATPNSADRGSDVNMTNGNERYRSWYLEEVTTLPVTFTNSYTSFSAPVPVSIPENCEAYIATSEDGKAVKMTQVTGDIAANTGLIISNATNLAFDIAASGTEYSENLLEANVAANDLSRAENYFFGKQKSTDNYIFTKLSGTGANYTLPGYKAYLPQANITSEDARISIIWGTDDSTGLFELNDENIKLSDGKYYQNGKVIVVRNGVKYNVAGQVIK